MEGIESIATLQQLITYIVTTIGVSGFSAWILEYLDSYSDSWFALLSKWQKRLTAFAIAAVAITVIWIIGVFAHYFDTPGPMFQLWLEAWFEVISPAILLQQIIHAMLPGKEKKDGDAAADKATA